MFIASRLSASHDCVAVCCSVLQCVAVCCSVLQCVAVAGTWLLCPPPPFQCLCCSALQCVAQCCIVLLWRCRIAVSMLHCMAVGCSGILHTLQFHHLHCVLLRCCLPGIYIHIKYICRFICMYVFIYTYVYIYTQTYKYIHMQIICVYIYA